MRYQALPSLSTALTLTRREAPENSNPRQIRGATLATSLATRPIVRFIGITVLLAALSFGALQALACGDGPEVKLSGEVVVRVIVNPGARCSWYYFVGPFTEDRAAEKWIAECRAKEKRKIPSDFSVHALHSPK